MQSSRVFSVLSRFPPARCVASSRDVCLILPDQPLFTSHLRGCRTHLNVPDRGIYGYAAGLSHAATEQLVLDGQIFHADRTHRNQPWESISRLLGRPEKRNLLLSQPDNMLQAQISAVEVFSATAATEDHDTYSPFRRVVEYCVLLGPPALRPQSLTCGSL